MVPKRDMRVDYDMLAKSGLRPEAGSATRLARLSRRDLVTSSAAATDAVRWSTTLSISKLRVETRSGSMTSVILRSNEARLASESPLLTNGTSREPHPPISAHLPQLHCGLDVLPV